MEFIKEISEGSEKQEDKNKKINNIIDNSLLFLKIDKYILNDSLEDVKQLITSKNIRAGINQLRDNDRLYYELEKIEKKSYRFIQKDLKDYLIPSINDGELEEKFEELKKKLEGDIKQVEKLMNHKNYNLENVFKNAFDNPEFILFFDFVTLIKNYFPKNNEVRFVIHGDFIDFLIPFYNNKKYEEINLEELKNIFSDLFSNEKEKEHEWIKPFYLYFMFYSYLVNIRSYIRNVAHQREKNGEEFKMEAENSPGFIGNIDKQYKEIGRYFDEVGYDEGQKNTKKE